MSGVATDAAFYLFPAALSVKGSNDSAWSFPFCFSRISTLPSACSSSFRQVAESCMPSSKSVRDLSKGISPFSSSCTIFSKRWRQSSNFGNGRSLAPFYCTSASLELQGARFRARSSQRFEHIHGRGVTALGGADLRTLHHRADGDQHFPGDG